MKTETLFKIVHMTLLTCIVINMTACSGGILVAGTPAGVKAYMDGTNGYITNGKSTADAHTEYYAARNAQEAEETKRAMAPSFLGELFGK